MFPRRSSQSAWGVSSDSDTNLKLLAVVGAGFLLFGALIGWSLNGLKGDSVESKDKPESAIINSTVEDVLVAPKSEHGATRAATALIVGMPQFSLMATEDQTKLFRSVMSPTSTQQFNAEMAAGLALIRQDLVGAPGLERQPSIKIVVSPLTFKTVMAAPDKATVSVWYTTSMINTQTQQARTEWSNATVNLDWTDHWRISGFAAASGPTPEVRTAGAQWSAYADVLKVFDGFKAYRSAVN